MIQISCPSYLSVFLQVVIITNWTVDKLEVLGMAIKMMMMQTYKSLEPPMLPSEIKFVLDFQST